VTAQQPVPEPTVYRLSLYHCFLGEILRLDPKTGITSRAIADQLDLKEETVRRDISFIGSVGRPGAGYKASELFDEIQTFLGITEHYPVVRVGTAEMLRALSVVFPAEAYGIVPVALYSENPEDAGQTVDGIAVQHVDSIPELDQSLGARVALVACSPEWVQRVLDLCANACIDGVLLVTPLLNVQVPEGVRVTQVRMPCDIKSLACRCGRAHGPATKLAPDCR